MIGTAIILLAGAAWIILCWVLGNKFSRPLQEERD